MSFENWEEVRLGNISNYRKNKVSFELLNSNNYISTDNLIVNRGGVTFSEYVPTKGKHNAFYKNDILISNIRPYFKKIYFPKYNGACSNDILVFCIKDTAIVEPKFLYYQLSKDDFFDYMMSTANGTKMPRGNKTAILNFKYNLPPLKTQKKIAKILSNYDDLIENNLKQIKLLEEKARLTYEEWFLRFRVDGVKLEIDSDSGLPFGWERIPIGKKVDLKQGFALNKKSNHYIVDKGLPLLKISDLLRETETLFVKDTIPKQFLVFENEIIYTRTAQVGYVFMGKRGVVYNNCFKVIPKEKIYTRFVYQYLNLKSIRTFAQSLATGTAQADLNHTAFKSIKIIYPTENFIIEFNKIVEPLYNSIQNLKLQNQNLKEARDILLPRLMTGVIEP